MDIQVTDFVETVKCDYKIHDVEHKISHMEIRDKS